MNLQSVIEEFAVSLSTLIEREVLARARDAVDGALGGTATGKIFKARRKGPKQLCPVPGCRKPAAPVFGMVCAEHKDLPKAMIKKYREQRRAKKLKAAA
jgi:hypothetical protein